ncbi:universal stress protein [Halobacterium sp. CBA1126]|uniref:universal stress protein n=1 Tax=Halobacterium TaxID=2239 RepID=UPI0012FC1A7F|nr:universal stress protein [Halobacterium sp. CBA1126]MUV60347.1 universal stress protein [Halobacterium sp. CBA1126]
MTYVVAFDDSPLSRAALGRAVAFADAAEEAVVAVTAIPQNADAAREHGWVGSEESFSVERAAANLAERVRGVDPGVEFDFRAVDKYAPRGRVSREVRDLAVAHDATVVFIGSDNAGRLVGGIASVGQNVSADDRYDVHIVRHAGD